MLPPVASIGIVGMLMPKESPPTTGIHEGTDTWIWSRNLITVLTREITPLIGVLTISTSPDRAPETSLPTPPNALAKAVPTEPTLPIR